MPFCPECGKENPPSAKFCRNCGTPLLVEGKIARFPGTPRPTPVSLVSVSLAIGGILSAAVGVLLLGFLGSILSSFLAIYLLVLSVASWSTVYGLLRVRRWVKAVGTVAAVGFIVLGGLFVVSFTVGLSTTGIGCLVLGVGTLVSFRRPGTRSYLGGKSHRAGNEDQTSAEG